MTVSPKISTAHHVFLRAPTQGDVAYLVEGLNEWGIAQWLPTVPFPYREEDAGAFISDTNRTNPPQAYVVASRETGEFLGVIGLSRNGGTPELGYWLLPQHHGRGFMMEAIQQLLACQDKSLAAIFATADPGNAPSIKLLEKAGFHLTGEHIRETPNRQGNLVVLRYQRDL